MAPPTTVQTPERDAMRETSLSPGEKVDKGKAEKLFLNHVRGSTNSVLDAFHDKKARFFEMEEYYDTLRQEFQALDQKIKKRLDKEDWDRNSDSGGSDAQSEDEFGSLAILNLYKYARMNLNEKPHSKSRSNSVMSSPGSSLPSTPSSSRANSPRLHRPTKLSSLGVQNSTGSSSKGRRRSSGPPPSNRTNSAVHQRRASTGKETSSVKGYASPLKRHLSPLKSRKTKSDDVVNHPTTKDGLDAAVTPYMRQLDMIKSEMPARCLMCNCTLPKDSMRSLGTMMIFAPKSMCSPCEQKARSSRS